MIMNRLLVWLKDKTRERILSLKKLLILYNSIIDPINRILQLINRPLFSGELLKSSLKVKGLMQQWSRVVRNKAKRAGICKPTMVLLSTNSTKTIKQELQSL